MSSSSPARGPSFGPVALIALLGAALLTLVAAVFAIRAAMETAEVDPETDYEVVGVSFQRIPFDALPDWRLDNVAEALPAFLRSCRLLAERPPDAPFNPLEAIESPFLEEDLLAGAVGDWLPLCEEAQQVLDGAYADEIARSSAARDFLMLRFEPVAVARRSEPRPDGKAAGREPVDDPVGKATGYFEPTFFASQRPSGRFSAPVYERPSDLIEVDLGAFDPKLKGRRLFGRLEEGALAPYPTRAEINGGAIRRVASPIAYMDPDDLFFLQIQGSGRLTVLARDGRQEISVGYNGTNGRPYFAIGRALVEKGEIALEDISMQSIRQWLDAAPPEEARKLRERNPSFVFFRAAPPTPDQDLGPVGAGGVQLTAMRSIAIDPSYYGYGGLIWAAWRSRDGREVGRLLVAQDTGGAIKGPIRGDVFVGSGPQAAETAGRMNDPATFAVLLPKSLSARFPSGPGSLAKPLDKADRGGG